LRTHRPSTGRCGELLGTGGESESADCEGRGLCGVSREDGNLLRDGAAAHHEFRYAVAARECRVRATIARAIRTSGSNGIASAKKTPSTAIAIPKRTIIRTNGIISRPNISLKTTRRIRNGRTSGKNRMLESRQNISLLTGRRLQ